MSYTTFDNITKPVISGKTSGFFSKHLIQILILVIITQVIYQYFFAKKKIIKLFINDNVIITEIKGKIVKVEEGHVIVQIEDGNIIKVEIKNIKLDK
jgi:hypothetical protein